MFDRNSRFDRTGLKHLVKDILNISKKALKREMELLEEMSTSN